jgi:hypothetical protein
MPAAGGATGNELEPILKVRFVRISIMIFMRFASIVFVYLKT